MKDVFIVLLVLGFMIGAIALAVYATVHGQWCLGVLIVLCALSIRVHWDDKEKKITAENNDTTKTLM